MRFQVTVDGRPVEVEREQLSRTVRTVYADRERVRRYTRLLADWMCTIPGLAEAAAELRETSAKESALQKALGELRNEVRKHLVDDDCVGMATSFALDPTNFHSVARLIADIDPSMRMDVKNGRRPYVSLVNGNKLEPYRPYEEGAKRADAFLERWRKVAKDGETQPDRPRAAGRVPEHVLDVHPRRRRGRPLLRRHDGHFDMLTDYLDVRLVDRGEMTRDGVAVLYRGVIRASLQAHRKYREKRS